MINFIFVILIQNHFSSQDLEDHFKLLIISDLQLGISLFIYQVFYYMQKNK